jgi:hypothetical protein
MERLAFELKKARRCARRQASIDLLAAILRGRRSNSRTSAKRSPPEAAKATLLSLTSISFRALAPPKKSMEESDLNFHLLLHHLAVMDDEFEIEIGYGGAGLALAS